MPKKSDAVEDPIEKSTFSINVVSLPLETKIRRILFFLCRKRGAEGWLVCHVVYGPEWVSQACVSECSCACLKVLRHDRCQLHAAQLL